MERGVRLWGYKGIPITVRECGIVPGGVLGNFSESWHFHLHAEGPALGRGGREWLTTSHPTPFLLSTPSHRQRWTHSDSLSTLSLGVTEVSGETVSGVSGVACLLERGHQEPLVPAAQHGTEKKETQPVLAKTMSVNLSGSGAKWDSYSGQLVSTSLLLVLLLVLLLLNPNAASSSLQYGLKTNGSPAIF